MTDWKKEICSSEPAELQSVSKDNFIERRNIVEVEHDKTEDMPAYTSWECDSRFISKDEYNLLKAIEGISTQDAIDAYTEQLIEGGIL